MEDPARDDPQEASDESPARLAAIVQSSDDAIVSHSLDGTIASWNPAAERLFGWTAPEVIGRPITLIVPEGRRAEEEAAVAAVSRGDRLEPFETVRVARNGRLVDVSLTLSPVMDAAGQIVGVSRIARDIRERRREEIERNRLAAIVDSSDDAIVGKTLDGTITSWNRAAEQLFGWTAAEAIGRHITLIIPEERRAEEDEVLACLRRGERLDHFETVRVTRDGRRIDVSLTVSPVRNAAGRIVGASKIAQDIGERRRAEIERNRLAAIVDSSDDAIVSKTLDGIVTSWNRGAEQLFGWTAAEAIGRHIRLIVPEDRWAEEDEVLARLRRGERLDHFETVRIRKDGRQIDVSLTVSPVRDAAGRIVGASKIARDVTERRRVEEERNRLLAREQQARAAAEALNRAKDEFLATLSHELRTPLNAIFGWARLLEIGDLDEATRERAVAAIVNSAAAQDRLVEDLLDLSRTVTGRLRLEFTQVDLASVVHAALDTVRPAATAKDIALVTTVGDVDPIRGAADRLQQVVWNLAMNAVKFTPRGGRIEVVVRRAAGYAEVVVSDNGDGISADLLPRVFDQFWQEDSSLTRAHGGLGSGLTLVKRLVELHGGRVRAESPGKGKGATFTVALPLPR